MCYLDGRRRHSASPEATSCRTERTSCSLNAVTGGAVPNLGGHSEPFVSMTENRATSSMS